jgi:hypothetical protein
VEPKDKTLTHIPVTIQVFPAHFNAFSLEGEGLLETKRYLTTLSAQDSLVVYFKVVLLCSVILASPLIFYQIWAFVAAGMYPNEKNYVYKYLPFSLGLFLTGIVLCQHEPSISHQKEVVADLDDFFAQARGTDVPWSSCRVLRPAIRRNIKLAEAPSFGKTIFDYEPWCPGAIDYRALAERVVGEWDAMLAKREGAPSTAAPTRSPAARDGAASPGGSIAMDASIAASIDAAPSAAARPDRRPVARRA